MKKSKIGIIFIIIFIVIIILAGIYVYASTDLFKTPEESFKKYLMNGFTQISEINIDPYTEVYARAQQEPIEIISKSEITIDGLQDGMTEDDSENETLKLKTTGTLKLDIPSKKTYLGIDIKNNDNDFFVFNYLAGDEKYAINIPELHEKYIGIENRDLRKLAKTLEVDEETIENIPDSITSESFTQEELNKIKEIISKYFEKFLNQTNTTSYEKEKYVLENIDDETLKGNKYILTISVDELNNNITTICKELLNDQEFLTLVDGKIDKNLIEEIKANFEEIETSATSENVEICIYEFKGKTVKLEAISSKGDIIEITILNKDTSSHMILKISTPKSEYNEVSSEIILDFTNAYTNNNGEAILNVKQTYNQEDVEALKKKEQEENTYFSYMYDDEYFESQYSETNITYKMSTTFVEDVINFKITYDGISEENISTKGISGTIKFGSKVNMPNFDDNNTIIINDYTSEDFENLITEFMANLSKSVQENPNTLFGVAMQIYMSSVSMVEEMTENEIVLDDTLEWEDIESEEIIESDDSFQQDMIETYRNTIYNSVKYSVETNLQNYLNDSQFDENVNIADYLNSDKIRELLSDDIDEMELIDGNTLKCIIDENTFFAKIYIDGIEWKLLELTVLYSQDGTLENAR